MKSRRWPVMLILLLLSATVAWAGSIYRWVDQDGVVHYSDGAPESSDGVSGAVESRPAVAGDPSPGAAGETGSPTPAAAPPPPSASQREQAVVEIYTTSWCRYCRDTKRYFRSRGMAFKEYDIEKDRAAARCHRRYNPRGGVPVTVINGQPIVGYAPEAFARALRGS